MDMRFDQIDIYVFGTRNLGGIMLVGSTIGAVITFGTAERGESIAVWPWISLALFSLVLIMICTGVLAQIVTARCAQDSLKELREIKDAITADRTTT